MNVKFQLRKGAVSLSVSFKPLVETPKDLRCRLETVTDADWADKISMLVAQCNIASTQLRSARVY